MSGLIASGVLVMLLVFGCRGSYTEQSKEETQDRAEYLQGCKESQSIHSQIRNIGKQLEDIQKLIRDEDIDPVVGSKIVSNLISKRDRMKERLSDIHVAVHPLKVKWGI